MVDLLLISCVLFFFFKPKTAYEMRISDWSSDVCSSDLPAGWSCPQSPPCAVPARERSHAAPPSREDDPAECAAWPACYKTSDELDFSLRFCNIADCELQIRCGSHASF